MPSKNQKEDNHKGPSRNKATVAAGLFFNINTFKSDMTSWCKSQGNTVPKFAGGHVATAAALEQLCRMILTNAHKQINTDKSGVCTLTRQTLKYSIRLHEGFNAYYMNKYNSYDKNGQYSKEFPVSKEIKYVYNSINKEFNLTAKAFQYLNFLLDKAYKDIISTALQFMEFANKKSFDSRATIFALNCKFADSVAYDVCKEVNRAMTALGDAVVEANADDADLDVDDESGEESDSDEVQEVKKTKKGSKKNKKKASKIETESSDEDLDVDIEEEPVVAKKSSKKASSKNKRAVKH